MFIVKILQLVILFKKRSVTNDLYHSIHLLHTGGRNIHYVTLVPIILQFDKMVAVVELLAMGSRYDVNISSYIKDLISWYQQSCTAYKLTIAQSSC